MKNKCVKKVLFLFCGLSFRIGLMAADDFLDPALQTAPNEGYAPAEITRFNFDIEALAPFEQSEQDSATEEKSESESNTDPNSTKSPSK